MQEQNEQIAIFLREKGYSEERIEMYLQQPRVAKILQREMESYRAIEEEMDSIKNAMVGIEMQKRLINRR